MMLKSNVNFLLQTTAFISFLVLVISYNAVFLCAVNDMNNLMMAPRVWYRAHKGDGEGQCKDSWAPSIRCGGQYQ